MMVKDNIIMSFMTRLKSIIDFNLVEIVDYWDGDLLAIGIKRGCKLVYLAANKSINSRLITYDFDFEIINEDQIDNIKVIKESRNVSERETIDEIREFLPTTDSQAYTEPFSMPEGNIVVSAVAVDEHDLVSSVARKNYIVNPQKSYTYTEALEILKDRMKELGMLNADEQTAPNGAAAVFSYVGNVTINDTELYQIRVDLKSGTQTTTEGNYGVGIKNGKCYQITGTEDAYQASSY